MNYSYYDAYINKKTKKRYDLTPLFEDAAVFKTLIEDLTTPFKGKKIDKIAALDASGFVIGSGVALRLKKGIILIRKKGKYPVAENTLLRASYTDYSKTEKTFEMKKSSIKKGEQILIVDDWIETGAAVNAAIHLVEKAGGIIAGVSVLHANKNRNTEILFKKYNCHSIDKF